MLKQKVKYLLACTFRRIASRGLSCPSCGSTKTTEVDRKYIVATLQRCTACRLQFVSPTTPEENSFRFYQKAYKQGFTTSMPSPDALQEYIESGMASTARNYNDYLSVIGSVVPAGSRVFEFGCSWGYGSWQIENSGYAVESYEISKPRAAFATESLGLKVHRSLDEVGSGFDLFFSSHVLEHVPSVKRTIQFGLGVLKPGGVLAAVTPNGSASFRRRNATAWHKSWGMVHPNLLDEIFYQATFVHSPVLIASNPFPLAEIRKWAAGHGTSHPAVYDLDGPELLVLVKKQSTEEEPVHPNKVEATR